MAGNGEGGDVTYRQYREAKDWLSRRRSVDISRNIFGIIPVGTHEVTVGSIDGDVVTFKEEESGCTIRAEGHPNLDVGDVCIIDVALPIRGHVVEIDYNGEYLLRDMETGKIVHHHRKLQGIENWMGDMGIESDVRPEVVAVERLATEDNDDGEELS